MKGITVYTLEQVLLGWPNRTGWDGQDM